MTMDNAVAFFSGGTQLARMRCIVGRTTASAAPIAARIDSSGNNNMTPTPTPGPASVLHPAIQGVPNVARLHNPTPANIKVLALTTLTARPMGSIAAAYP
mmetsp:Transcript_16092/g.34753  ORF Transcript_16092/g.34753 Transcript_16092/m.34753 type:complete len:100 (+) Transcript_16092:556-855(+)